MLDLETIVVSSIIAFGMAIFFRYIVRPNIELVYEENRISLIKGMLKQLYLIDVYMKNVYGILEKQQNFIPIHAQTFSFSDGDYNRLKFYHDSIKKIANEFKKFQDWRVHIRDDEILAIANYANFSDLFLEWLIRQPYGEYAPEYLEQRKGCARDILKFFKKQVKFEFKRDWEAVL